MTTLSTRCPACQRCVEERVFVTLGGSFIWYICRKCIRRLERQRMRELAKERAKIQARQGAEIAQLIG
jgi:hypothetical protein